MQNGLYNYYFEQFLILASTITECISISVFASLLGIPTRITSSLIGLKICAITASIQKYKSIIKKKKTNLDKIALLTKSKLNRIEVLISKVLTDSVISHNEFVLINNVLKIYGKMKKQTKNLETGSILSKFLVYL